MKIVAALLGIALIVSAIMLGGGTDSLWSFLNLPSLLFVGGCTVLFTLAQHAPGDVAAALRAACGGPVREDREIAGHVAVLSTLRTLAAGSGVAGTLVGLVLMLGNLEDPSAIGPGMAVGLLTALYGILLAEFLLGPMIQRLGARRAASGDSDRPAGPGASGGPAGPSAALLMASLFVPLVGFWTLMSIMS